MHITPFQASAIVTGAAILIGVFIVAFNLGRLDMAAKARQCHAPITFTIPFKGTLP